MSNLIQNGNSCLIIWQHPCELLTLDLINLNQEEREIVISLNEDSKSLDDEEAIDLLNSMDKVIADKIIDLTYADIHKTDVGLWCDPYDSLGVRKNHVIYSLDDDGWKPDNGPWHVLSSWDNYNDNMDKLVKSFTNFSDAVDFLNLPSTD